MYYHKFLTVVLSVVFLQAVSCEVFERLFTGTSSCETNCKTFFAEFPKAEKSCDEGCRLYTVIGLAKGGGDINKTTELCVAACTEAFVNASEVNACHYGCSAYPPVVPQEEEPQTLHLLIPLMYVKSAYNTVSRHVKQFISTSWTVYVQEDNGKAVLLQASPKVLEGLEYAVTKDQDNDRDYQAGDQESGSGDWMDCISQQSGIPRWLIVMVLFAFVFALLWLCCATTATAPNHYVSSSKKRDLGYVVVCETNRDLKIPLLPPAYPGTEKEEGEQAPPLPPKVSLI